MMDGFDSRGSADRDTRDAGPGRGRRHGRKAKVVRRRAERRRLLAALTLSIAAHVLVLGARFDLQLGAAGGMSRAASAGPDGSLMRALDLVITPDAVPTAATPAEAVAPARRSEPERPDVSPSAAADAAGSARAEVAPSNRAGLRERLAPRVTDRRLWLDPVHSSAVAAEEAARIRAPVRDGVAALNDSITVESERERRASDWTVRDEDDGRWGISPDRVHLGGLTLKLRHCTVDPCEGWLFPTPVDRKDEYENRLRGFAEIRLQASRADLEEALEVRAAAIRMRLGAQRDSSKGG